jgi:ketosteroid isomerase-like protein
MSEQDVEIARQVMDAFNGREVDRFFEHTAPDFEWFPAMPGLVGDSGYRGREGVETYLVDIGDTWEEYRVLAEELRDLGDRVLMLGRIEGRGRGSRAWVDTPTGTIFDFRDGEVVRVRTYLDHAEALKAAGLEE